MRLGILFFCWVITTATHGQISVVGSVSNSWGEALPGATVQAVKPSQDTLADTERIGQIKKNLGTESDTEGRFTLVLPISIQPYYDLWISYEGYRSEFIRVSADTTLTVRLEISPSLLAQQPSIAPRLSVFELTTRRSFSQAHPSVAKLDELAQLPTAQLSLPEVLNYLPGVFAHTGALNTNRITIRGIGSRTPFGTDKVKAYLDNIPLTDGSGSSSLEDIDLGSIQRVRVFRGPTASIFGAGLGGVIQLNTEATGRYFWNRPALGAIPLSPHPLALAAPLSFIAPPPRPLTTLQYGSFGTLVARLQLDHSRKKVWQHSLRLHHTQQEGYRANNRVRRTGLLYRGGHRLTAQHSLTWLFSHTDFLGFIPSALNRTDYTEDPSRAAANWRAVAGNEDYSNSITGLTWKAQYGKWEQRLTVFGKRRINDETRPFNILLENSLIGGARGIWGTPRLRDRWSFLGGFEALRERLDWQTEANADRELLSEQRELRQYMNTFAQLQYSHQNWRIWGGLNYNQTDYRLTDEFLTDGEDRSGRFDFNGIISPYLHIVRENLRPGKVTLLPYAIVSHGFSPPGLEETLTPDGVYNPDIRPETGWNYETGITFQFPRERQLRLTCYRMDIRNLLVARRTGLDQFIGVNAGRSLHQGIELSGRYPWNPIDRHHLLLSGQGSFQPYRFVDFVDGDDDFSGNRLTGSPRYVARVRLQHVWELRGAWQWENQLDQQWVGDQPITDANDLFADGYAVSNWRSSLRLPRIKRLDTHFYVGISNLFDARYAAMLNINARAFGGREPRYFYPGLPRHFYVGLRLAR